MGMELVLGGAGSGKSAYGEARAAALAGGWRPLYYLATMEAEDEESRRRVERHRRMRAGKGFSTLELSRDVGRAAAYLEPEGVLLLECLSTLAANTLFGPRGMGDGSAVLEALWRDLRLLEGAVCHMVVVSNHLFEDTPPADPYTGVYMDVLAGLHCRLAGACGRVVEVEAGLPLVWKGV